MVLVDKGCGGRVASEYMKFVALATLAEPRLQPRSRGRRELDSHLPPSQVTYHRSTFSIQFLLANPCIVGNRNVATTLA